MLDPRNPTTKPLHTKVTQHTVKLLTNVGFHLNAGLLPQLQVVGVPAIYVRGSSYWQNARNNNWIRGTLSGQSINQSRLL